MKGRYIMANKKTKIRVTQQDIKDGKREKCTRCPIALAVQRQVINPGNYDLGIAFDRVYPRVDDSSLSICVRETDGHTRARDKVLMLAYLPDMASDFIGCFDNDEKVKPFTFEIKLQNPA
jgi:hypothetical protein